MLTDEMSEREANQALHDAAQVIVRLRDCDRRKRKRNAAVSKTARRKGALKPLTTEAQVARAMKLAADVIEAIAAYVRAGNPLI